MNLSAVTLGNREVQCPLWPAYALFKAVGGDNKCYLSFVAAQAYIRWKLLWSVQHDLGRKALETVPHYQYVRELAASADLAHLQCKI